MILKKIADAVAEIRENFEPILSEADEATGQIEQLEGGIDGLSEALGDAMQGAVEDVMADHSQEIADAVASVDEIKSVASSLDERIQALEALIAEAQKKEGNSGA